MVIVVMAMDKARYYRSWSRPHSWLRIRSDAEELMLAAERRVEVLKIAKCNASKTGQLLQNVCDALGKFFMIKPVVVL